MEGCSSIDDQDGVSGAESGGFWELVGERVPVLKATVRGLET